MYQVAFTIVGIGWMILLMYLQMRLQGIVIHINNRYPLNLKWRRWPSRKEMREISRSDDEQLKAFGKNTRRARLHIGWFYLVEFF